jgi:hypothetical protein
MPDSVFTPETLDAPARRPGLLALRLLERRLDERLAGLDARVDMLLDAPGPYTDAEVSAVDVLCAAIAEVTELRDAARRDVVRERAARHARRSGVRRWG